MAKYYHLAEAQRFQISTLKAMNVSQQAIAAELKVSQSTISSVLTPESK